MRQKLNENPVAQIGLVGLLIVAAGFLLLSQMGGGQEAETAAEPAPPGAVEEAGAPAEAAGPEGGGAPAGAAVSIAGTPPEIAAATTSTSAPTDRELPPQVNSAYAEGKTIALLVVRDGGIDDHLVREATAALDGMSRVSFFSTKARNIARFARITGPLGVNQAPALVVIRPKELNGDGPAPASVTYGFQTKNDVRQAIHDAVYRGRTLTYAPN